MLREKLNLSGFATAGQTLTLFSVLHIPTVLFIILILKTESVVRLVFVLVKLIYLYLYSFMV